MIMDLTKIMVSLIISMNKNINILPLMLSHKELNLHKCVNLPEKYMKKIR